MKVHVGFAGGVTRCFVLKPIGLVMSRCVLTGLQRLLCWIRLLERCWLR